MDKILIREKIKTIILVVLFISTVLLSYLYWQDMSFWGIKETVNEHLMSSMFNGDDIPSEAELISPSRIQINNGNGTYSVYQHEIENIWKNFIESYLKIDSEQDLIVEEITQELWKETMDVKSIQYIFDYNFPVEFFNILGISRFNMDEYFSSVDIIALSEASISSIFIRDDVQKKYFRIITNIEDNSLADEIYNVKDEVNQYYPVSMILGTDNDLMLPYYTNVAMPDLLMTSINHNIIQTYEKDIAKTFFGQRLEFIRRIVDDSETITYMYGLGQKILTIYADGRFEYQENKSSQNDDTNVEEAFYIATNFIKNHGSWSSYDGKDLAAKLVDVSIEETDEGEIYTFKFNEHYENYQIYNADTSDIVIKITGSTVTYYSRNIQIYVPSEIGNSEENTLKNESIINILSCNYKSLIKLLKNHGIIEDKQINEDEFDKMVSNISNIEIGYFKYSSDQSSQYLKPSWVLEFNGFKIFYDLYTGKYLGYLSKGFD